MKSIKVIVLRNIQSRRESIIFFEISGKENESQGPEVAERKKNQRLRNCCSDSEKVKNAKNSQKTSSRK